MNFVTVAAFCEMILLVRAEFLDKYSLLMETWRQTDVIKIANVT